MASPDNKGSRAQNRLMVIGYKKFPTEQREINSGQKKKCLWFNKKGIVTLSSLTASMEKTQRHCFTNPGMSWLMPEDRLMNQLCSRNRSTWLNPKMFESQILSLNPKYEGGACWQWLTTRGDECYFAGNTRSSIFHHILFKCTQAELSHPGRDVKWFEGRFFRARQRRAIDKNNSNGNRKESFFPTAPITQASIEE